MFIAAKTLLGDYSIAAIIRRMASTNLAQSLTEEEIGRELIRLVPQWYEAACGPEEYSILIGQTAASFFHHGCLTPNLAALLEKICTRARELQLERFPEFPGLIDILVESFAVEWLRLHAADTDWVRLINYLETVARRAAENLPVALTAPVQTGNELGDITHPRLQRFFDRLAASPFTFTYLAVDADLQLIDYGSVEWSQVNNAASYNFYPEFLHPIRCAMNDDDLVAHVTSRGELIIMNKTGVLATKRKRKWKIYDAPDFENWHGRVPSEVAANPWNWYSTWASCWLKDMRVYSALITDIMPQNHRFRKHRPDVARLNPSLLPELEYANVGRHYFVVRSKILLSGGSPRNKLREKRQLIEMAETHRQRGCHYRRSKTPAL